MEQAEVSSPVGSPLVLLAEYVTLAGESVTLALLDLSAECVTLAGVATLESRKSSSLKVKVYKTVTSTSLLDHKF
jgi:hypothetical protein